MGGEELKWHQLQSANELARIILVHAVELKPTIKVQISGRMASIGISHFSILGEKPSEQVDDDKTEY